MAGQVPAIFLWRAIVRREIFPRRRDLGDEALPGAPILVRWAAKPEAGRGRRLSALRGPGWPAAGI